MPVTPSLTLALCPHRIARHDSIASLFAALDTEAAAAAAGGAGLLVFPEYGAMELTGLPGMTNDPEDVPAQIAAIQHHREAWVETHRMMARTHTLTVIAGSIPWRLDNGTLVNRAWIAHPDGRLLHQDKAMMTRFEREHWGITGGSGGLGVFEVAGVRCAIAICYDIEFPLLVRDAVERGAQLVLSPSNTDGMHGYHRVATGARARAMENQIMVAMVPLLGFAGWTTAIDINVGRAGVFGPIDTGFPEDGVLAMGSDESGLLFATIHPRRLESVRRHGQNHNFTDWALGWTV